MSDETATPPRGTGVRRLLLRVAIVVGGIAALWLLAPAAASADEGSGLGDVLGSATDAVGGVTDVATDAVGAVMEPVEQVTGTLTQTVEQVAEPVTQVVEPVAGAVEQVTDTTVGTLQQVVDTTTGTVEEVVTEATGTSLGVLDDAAGSVEDVTLPNAPAPETPHPDTRVATTPEQPTTGGSRFDVERPSPTLREPTAATAFLVEPERNGSTQPPAPGGATDRPEPTAPGHAESTSRDGGLISTSNLQGPSSGQDLGVLVTAILIALVLVRWSRREAELRLSPAILSLLERPG